MIYRLFILAAIIAVNAFFAAAEVALVSVRRSRLRAMAERGVTGAQAAISLLARPERLLSVTQVGVTLASLALGWAGEPTFAAILSRMLGPLSTTVAAPYLHAASFTLAFVLMTLGARRGGRGGARRISPSRKRTGWLCWSRRCCSWSSASASRSCM